MLKWETRVYHDCIDEDKCGQVVIETLLKFPTFYCASLSRFADVPRVRL